MSSTDNAFIKVYQHQAEVGPKRPAIVGGLDVDEKGITVRNSRVTLSQTVAAASVSTSPTGAPQTDRGLSPASPPPAHQPQPSRVVEPAGAPPVPRKPTRQDDEPGREVLRTELAWLDGPHASTPAPHVETARFAESKAGPTSEPQPRFRPSWEVDRFRWPALSDELLRDWASPLTGIVKSVVRQAWRGSNVVGVTQFGRAEGATTLALCLSRIAASFHIRVALVDGNLHNPDIGASLGLRYDQGWEQTNPQHALEESAIFSIEDRLTVLPLLPRSGDLPEASEEQRVSILERLAHVYELVILDTGPVFEAAHAWFSRATAQRIRSALIVRDTRRTDTAQLDDVCCRLRDAGISEMSVVENFYYA